METPPSAKYIAEFVGTFVLMFTIAQNVVSGSVGAALSIGATLMVLIFALGSVSGGHFNPAVTLSVLLSGRGKITAADATAYIIFQVCGALVGASLSSSITGKAPFVEPKMHYSMAQAMGLEIVYTAALCYVVLNVATTQAHKDNQFAGMAIGFTVISAVVAIGPVSGCSLNPAVSIGASAAAAYRSNRVAQHAPLYVLAPLVGAIIAWLMFYLVRRGQEFGSKGGYSKYLDYDGRSSAIQTRHTRLSLSSSPVQLLSGQSIHLNRSLEARELFVGMKSESRADSSSFDLDFSCVKFDRDGKSLGAVYFAELEDHENGIHHAGAMSATPLISNQDDEMISFRLSKFKPNLHYLFFVATVFASGERNFQDIQQFNLRLVNAGKGPDRHQELCSFRKTNIGSGNSMVCGMLYRDADDTWRFEAIDKCYSIPEHGTYRNLEPQLQRLCNQKRELEG
eukprot:GEMP01026778.1.p1 GENE.GEMP01026778.1~~GEMP01026778.1.p1  ORF type:complete len:453 (+),score=61.36 GEMP01026778.1:416-1774(+)